MSHVEVSRATEADLETLAQLQWQWRVEEWSGAPETDREGFSVALRRFVGEHSDSHPAFVARLDGRVVGMGWLATLDRVPTPVRLNRRNGHVQSVYVVPGKRDHGVGTALLARLIEEARQRGFDHLMVHPSERSFAFYRRHGFIGSGEMLELRLRP